MKTSVALSKPSDSFTELTKSLDNLRKNKLHVKKSLNKSDKNRSKLPLLKTYANNRDNNNNFAFIDNLLDSRKITQRHTRVNKWNSKTDTTKFSFESYYEFITKRLTKSTQEADKKKKISENKNRFHDNTSRLNVSWKSDQLLPYIKNGICFESDNEEVNRSITSKTPGILKSPDKIKRPKSKVSFVDESLIKNNKKSLSKRMDVLETDTKIVTPASLCDTNLEILYSNPNTTRENTNVSTVDQDRINYLFENKQDSNHICVVYNDDNKKVIETFEIL
jgi:hypothetical protein